MNTYDYLKPGEAADYLRVQTTTMRNWRSLGQGPRYIKVGSRVLYSRADLDAFLAAGAVEPVGA